MAASLRLGALLSRSARCASPTRPVWLVTRPTRFPDRAEKPDRTRTSAPVSIGPGGAADWLRGASAMTRATASAKQSFPAEATYGHPRVQVRYAAAESCATTVSYDPLLPN